MKKFSRIIESLDKWEDMQDYLLELTESGFLELENSPRLTNDYGETGSGFNPIITTDYFIKGFDKISDMTKLESYISVLSRLSTALKRGSFKFELTLTYLVIYFDLPSKLDKLMIDIGKCKKQNNYIYGEFMLDLFGTDSYKNDEPLIVNIKFEIDSNFTVKLDVKGGSWVCIGELNKLEGFQKDLINHFVKNYGFKYIGTSIENRQLDDYGKVKHWYFEV